MQNYTPILNSVYAFFILFIFMASSCGDSNNTANSKTTETSVIMPYKEAKKQLSKSEKIGQLFMPAAYINDSEEGIQAIEKLIREQNVGALCFFHSRISTATNFGGTKEVAINTKSLEQLKLLISRYQKAAKYPLLIAIDAEWGLAMRVENTPQYPYAITLGAIQNRDDLIFELGKNMAVDLKDAGIHWNLAPVVDINNNPNNPVISYRSFGENKILVTQKSIAYSKGLQSQGVLSCAKHFPGHGDTATDSHIGLPIIEKSKDVLYENELYPFKELIKANVDAIMVGHLSVPALANGSKMPATISKEMIKGVLRNELGFKKVVISDALNMHSVSKMFPTKGELEWVAFDAGNDFLCFAENTLEGVATISKNATVEQIEASFKRIWKLKEKAFIVSKNNIKPTFSQEELNAEIARASLSIIKAGNTKVASLRNQSFVGIEFNKTVENEFFKSISSKKPFKSYSTKNESIESLKNNLKREGNILIALFPPNIKPKGKFGLTTDEINFINELNATKNVVLYLFGNPYVLNHIKTTVNTRVITVYQDFKVFQNNAAQHFLGNIDANGKSPITL